MKRDERRQAIMDLLVGARAVDLDDLADRFAVSRMTIHRDLDDLEQAGLLRKVRGGATIEAGTQFESDFRIRALQDSDAKARMARAALDLVEPGMTVMVNDGSMAALLGANLTDKAPLTVITNNAAVIDRLKDAPRITLIALGGTYSAKFNGFFGVLTEKSIAELRADIAFLSSSAIDGRTAFHQDQEVLEVKRGMIASSASRYLMVDHRKFGRTALHRLADLDVFDGVVTSAALPQERADALRQDGIKLYFAEEG